MPIYTKTGDDGTTALFGGKRVPKSDPRVDLYGSIDELNSWIGLIRTGLERDNVYAFLEAVQSDLFTIGSILAEWQGSLTPAEARIPEMERLIDELERQLPPLTNFILPGGSETASRLHITRNVCRRVERLAVVLNAKTPLHPVILKYLNRLSDLLFMLARFINKSVNIPDQVWSGIPRK